MNFNTALDLTSASGKECLCNMQQFTDFSQVATTYKITSFSLSLNYGNLVLRLSVISKCLSPSC